MTEPCDFPLGRRAFLAGGTLTLLGVSALPVRAESEPSSVRFGLLTDLHYADKPAAGTRYYRETPAKLDECVGRFADERLDFVAEFGDLIDSAETVATERSWLAAIHAKFAPLACPRHFVLGNHCVESLTKAEFLDGVGQERSYYSFDARGVHFVILDACFRGDGVPYGRKNSQWDDANIPADELDWLRGDLAAAKLPIVVFAHQRLDGESRHCVKNAAAVRSVLEGSGRVLAVFQGHSHENDYREIAGIHYATLAAMIEGSGEANNSYAVAEITADGTIRVHGFRRQTEYAWSPKTRAG